MMDRGRTPSEGRRSKLGILRDIFQAMADGADRPTQIARKANINWNVLFGMLTAMVNNGMVTQTSHGSHLSYHLAEEGRTFFDAWTKSTRRAAAVVTEAGSYHPGSVLSRPSDVSAPSDLTKVLQAAGFGIADDVIKGRSGVEHRFNVVGEAHGGSKHGFLFYDRVEREDVISAFMRRMDTEVNVHIVHSGGVSDEAAKLAKSYSIRLIPLEAMKGSELSAKALFLGDVLLSGSSLLMSVDPSVPYEQAVKAMVDESEARGRKVVLFTSKVSPVYKALSSSSCLKFFLMTPSAGGSEEAEAGRFIVPDNDTSILLDSFQRSLASDPGAVIVFDSISDLILSQGLQKSYEFMKQAGEMVDEAGSVGMYLMKEGAHDEGTTSFIKSLIQNHVAYNDSGLNLTRTAQG